MADIEAEGETKWGGRGIGGGGGGKGGLRAKDQASSLQTAGHKSQSRGFPVQGRRQGGGVASGGLTWGFSVENRGFRAKMQTLTKSKSLFRCQTSVVTVGLAEL